MVGNLDHQRSVLDEGNEGHRFCASGVPDAVGNGFVGPKNES
jgi:hypothetical protein